MPDNCLSKKLPKKMYPNYFLAGQDVFLCQFKSQNKRGSNLTFK